MNLERKILHLNFSIIKIVNHILQQMFSDTQMTETVTLRVIQDRWGTRIGHYKFHQKCHLTSEN
jgi:hypothetical protein